MRPSCPTGRRTSGAVTGQLPRAGQGVVPGSRQLRSTASYHSAVVSQSAAGEEI
ncbi:hypothetical protein [Streptomyces sp. NPDC018693]|uniref:hypothetical protein n=1 Tax=unclassified Streptomyces TaxID=2593676 RepID=UPI0037AA8FFF